MTKALIETLSVREGRTDHRDINPKDIRADFLTLIDDNNIEFIYNHRINSCQMDGVRILTAIFDLAPFTEEGLPPQLSTNRFSLVVKAKMFIDASYEGELMAHANVSFRVGRESRMAYDEELAGVQQINMITYQKKLLKYGQRLKW